MDGIGLVLSLSLVAAVFVFFELLVRLLGGVAGAIRYSVAPAMVTGFRSWSETRGEWEPPATTDDVEPPAGGQDVGHPRAIQDDGLVVPVTRVARDGGRLAAA